MGAAASVARKYHIDEKAARGYEFTLTKYHALIEEAHRSGFNKEELQHLIDLLRQKHLNMLAQIHRHTDPVYEALKPYYDKYQPVVKYYAVKSYRHVKVAYDRVDHAVTTATLQAIYQARRQLVAQLSDATIASYFAIAIADVIHIQVSKRTFSIQNAGCDLRHYELEHSFLIEDKQFIKKLLELQWVPWQPTTTIAVKLIETFVLQIEYYTRNEFAIRIPAKLALRVGSKWVALDTRESNHKDRPKWLQRIDFKEREKRSTLFFDLINNSYDRMKENWEKKQEEMAAQAVAEAAAKALEEAAQQKNKQQPLSVLTPEMIRRTLAMFSQKIMDEERYQFYTLHSFENWRMEMEDTLINGTQTIGELCELDAMIQEDDLLKLYARRVIEGAERVRMETEDINRAITKEELAALHMQKFDLDVESDWSDDESNDDL
ncbi:hypothetical protein THRCLA_21181 [Thraustotheca clavata]|uniref:Uncharacterized protein n=1 Tax=Thraustotheca clavata TaxID=74557 RepID=A0A1V9ZZB1_9STRA|nr:hypothetical protein THRCLA_21181 [Thraustotheca clavata]